MNERKKAFRGNLSDLQSSFLSVYIDLNCFKKNFFRRILKCIFILHDRFFVLFFFLCVFSLLCCFVSEHFPSGIRPKKKRTECEKRKNKTSNEEKKNISKIAALRILPPLMYAKPIQGTQDFVV